ncbi:LysE family translocator [Methanolobus psychrotolerans]|uniref:LysE family translocator n=1 Tax=Methanolobus psychrotolerans TaxID=1874706 RepID=UPI000B9190B4|nr:LysE family transporter [Methanolobus psychrotolerans]
MYGIAEFLFIGIFLGFAAGISPGPLMAMTISQTLTHGSKDGIKVALSPLITDILIVSAIIFILLHFENQNFAIAIISLSGAIYLIHLGISSLKIEYNDLDVINEKTNSLKKGVIVNFLSPHPYLFWITIGGPIIFQALDINILATVLFVAGFYTFLVGSKILIALVVGRSRSFLISTYYIYTMRALGIVYLLFAFFFIGQGAELLGLYIPGA